MPETLQLSPGGTVGYIAIDDKEGMISQSTWLYVKQALKYYRENRPQFIVLKLNTPGGEVFAAQKISDALEEMDTQEGVPVVSFIDDWAVSAGAMIAYSTRYIVPVKDAIMGAAEPVTMGEGGKMESASEKVNSALRADMVKRALFFNRNPDIAEAMVDKDVILVWREGKVARLDSEEQIRWEEPNPDKVISARGKLLTLTAPEMEKFGVADAVLTPERLEPISVEERAEGRWPFSKMLLSRAPGFSEASEAVVEAYRMDWKTQFFVLLATPIASSILMLGLIVGWNLEVNTPGFGLPGAVALTCLFLIAISSLSLEIANWLELIFLAAGLLLVLTEFFLFPTGGFLAIIGSLFFIGGLFAMMLPGLGTIDFQFDTGSLNAAGELFFQRLAYFSATLVLAFVILALLGRYVTPSLAGFNLFVLTGHEQEAKEGYIAGEAPSNLPQPGAAGVAVTTLRPSGKIEVAGTLYEAVTDGAFIEKGEKIVLDRLEGSVIVVFKEK